MGSPLVELGTPAWAIVVRSIVIYLALLFGLRILGKRQVGQFSLADLIMILLVANALQPAMTGPDNSLVGGLLIIATLLVADWIIDYLRERVPFIRRAFESPPTVIARDGRWLLRAMEREGVEMEEAETALREHGIERVEDTTRITLEPDGRISVIARPGRCLGSQGDDSRGAG
ncbi:MAG: DUF421 domain-containing protein [Chloroflexota bacterium]